MIRQRKSVLWTVTLLLLIALTSCTASAVQVPKRTISVSTKEAMDAQNAGMTALASGNVEWSESQFSSLLSELLKANSGSDTPIKAIHAWFEPKNEIYLRVVLKQKVLRVGDTLDLKGTVAVLHNHVVVTLQQAGAGNMSVGEPMLAALNAQINGMLANANLGVAATVKTDTGKLMLKIGS